MRYFTRKIKFMMSSKDISNVFSQWTKSIQPLSQNISRTIGQATQLAKERLGSTQDITELPLEYRQLEQKLDNIRLIHEMYINWR